MIERMPSSARSGKLVYLFYYSAAAVLMPQLTYYYRSTGLTGRQVGILAAIAPAAGIFGASLWAAAADITGKHRAVLGFVMIGAIVSAQFLGLGATFAAFLPAALFLAFLSSAVMPIVDRTVLSTLRGGKDHYGRYRLWGAVGWGAAAPLAGVLIGRLGLGAVFPAYGVLMAACMVASLRLDSGRPRVVMRKGEGFLSVLKDRRWFLFLFIVLIRGIGGAFVHHYLIVYMGELGASAVLRGLALTSATVSELAVYYHADRIVRRFGAERTIAFSVAVTAVRLFLHFIVRSPLPVLAVQLLHGVTFSIFIVAGVTLANKLAPKGMETTAQGLFSAINFGAAGIVGAYVGGELLEAVGVYRMYLYAAIATGVGLAAYLILLGCFRRSERAARPSP